MPKGSKNILVILIINVTLFAYAKAHVPHPENKTDLKKRLPVHPLPPPKPFDAHKSLEQFLYVRAHNDLRKQVHVTPLEWDQSLTAKAHDWAVKRSVDCNYRLHSNNSHGENIYWMNYNEFSPSDVVQSWFNEYKFYDHVKNMCTCQPERVGCECGHYLNVIWYNTRRVGCSGIVYCDHQKGVLVVCQYDPPGLIPGINPFNGAKMVKTVLDSLSGLATQGNDNNTELINQVKHNTTELINQVEDNTTELIHQGKSNSTEPNHRGKSTNSEQNQVKDNTPELINQGNDNNTELTNRGNDNTTKQINQEKGDNTEPIHQGNDKTTEPISRGGGNNT